MAYSPSLAGDFSTEADGCATEIGIVSSYSSDPYARLEGNLAMQQDSRAKYLLNVRNKTPLCSVGVYLKMNGNTMKKMKLPIKHVMSVPNEILKGSKQNRNVHSKMSIVMDKIGFVSMQMLFTFIALWLFFTQRFLVIRRRFRNRIICRCYSEFI